VGVAKEFDPYHKWLGIAPEDQPPNHYQLLGVRKFESDEDVLEMASDRQLSHLRTFQSGKHSQLSQKILNEVTIAKICLLTPAKRAAYDERLRAEAPIAAPPAAGTAPDSTLDSAAGSATSAANAETPLSAPPPPTASSSDASTGNYAPLSLAPLPTGETEAAPEIAAEAADDSDVLEATVIADPPPRKPALDPAAALTGNTAALHAGKNFKGTAKRTSLPRRTPQRSNAWVFILLGALACIAGAPLLLGGGLYYYISSSRKTPAEIDTGDPTDPGDHRARMAEAARRRAAERTGRPVTRRTYVKMRLSSSELATTEVRLNDTPLRQGLVSRSGTAEYDLAPGNHTLEFRREGHEPYVKSFSLREGSSYTVYPRWQPISRVAIRMPPKNRDKATISVDGKPVVFDSRSTVYLPVDTGVHTLAVKTPGYEPFETSFAATRGKLTSFSPDWIQAAGEFAMVKLGSMIDVSQNSVLVRWKSENGALTSPLPSPGLKYKILTPYKPPRTYVLKATVERIAGDGPAVLQLVAGGNPCPLVIDDQNQVYIPEYRERDQTLISRNAAGDILPAGKPVNIKCTVTSNEVYVQFDDATPSVFKESFYYLRGSKRWPFPLTDVIAFGGEDGQFRFTNVELWPLSEGGALATIAIASIDPDASTTVSADTGSSNNSQAPQSDRKPVPSADALAAAKKRIETNFPDTPKNDNEYQSRAVELGKIARSENDGTAAQYQLYLEASIAAAKAGDGNLATGYVDEMASVFDIDRLKGAAFFLIQAGGRATTDTRRTHEHLSATEDIVRQLIADGRYSEAATLAEKIASQIRRPPAVVNTAKALKEHTASLAGSHAKYKAAKKLLDTDQDNAAANLEVGQWLAFRQNNWPAALPHLAKGSNADMAQAAQQAMAGPPSTLKEMMARGNAWKKIADGSTDGYADFAMLRAGYYWQMAVPQSTALDKIELNKKLRAVSRIRDAMPGLQGPGAVGSIPEGVWYNLLANLKLPQGVRSCSWRQNGSAFASGADSACVLMLPAIVQGSYDLQTTFTTKSRPGVGLILPVAHRNILLEASLSTGSVALRDVSTTDTDKQMGPGIGILQPGVKQTLEVSVKVEGDDVKIASSLNNGRPVEWSGKIGDIGLPGSHNPGLMMQPCLTTSRTETIFHSARIMPHSPASPQGAGAAPPYAESLMAGRWNSYQTTRDLAPQGARLAAVEVSGDQYSISGIRPIYQKGRQIIAGQPFGDMTRKLTIVAPRDGYAIGGFDAHVASGHSQLYRLRIVFMRRRTNGLDPTDTYESEWFGRDPLRACVTRLSGNGAELAGLACSYNFSSSPLGAIALIVKQTPQTVLPDSNARYALAFDGRTSLVRTNLNQPPGTPVTLEAFVTPMASGNNVTSIIVGHKLTYGGVRLGINQGFFTFSMAGADRILYEVYSDTPFHAGQRYHIAGVYDGQQLQMYVNGQRQMNQVLQSGGMRPSTLPYAIGAGLQGTGSSTTQHFMGLIEQVHVAFAPVYQRNFSPPLQLKRHPKSKLLHLYNGGGTAATVRDSSGNNMHGNTVNTAWQKQ